PVAGEKSRLRAGGEAVQRGHIVAHRAIGWSDDAGRPAHHTVAGAGAAGIGQGEGEAIGGVSGRGDRLEHPALADNAIAVDEVPVAIMGRVVRLIEGTRFAGAEGPSGAMRTA